MISLIGLLPLFALCSVVQGSYRSSNQYRTVIAVTAELEKDCLNNGSHYHYTIDELPTLNVSNGTLFRFCSPSFVLKSGISFSDVSFIGFVGFEFTKLTCNNISDVGIELERVSNIEMQNIGIESCGINVHLNDFKLKAGLAISNSTDIRLTNVTVTRNSGTGLALFYNSGFIEITNVTFKGNGVDGMTGGNGVYVETGPDSPANYSFVNCSFLDNKAVTGKDNIIQYSPFDKGGGMCLHVNSTNNIIITIIDSTFKENEAQNYGGGVYISYYGKCTNNIVTIKSTKMEGNTAIYGGGVHSSYLHSRYHAEVAPFTPQNSSLVFSDVTFTNNTAEYGGGFSLSSNKSPNSDSNNFARLENCEWTDNKGQYGAAVAILPNAWNTYTVGYFPIFFVNSTFKNNVVKSMNISNDTHQFYNEFSKGFGTFYCLKHNISFAELSRFQNNTGSALFLDSCVGIFSNNSVLCFKKNHSFRGGAMYLLSSVIYVDKGSTLQFHENKADDKGGAIYERTTSALLHHYSKTCFIDFIGASNIAIENRNIQISFVNNTAAAKYSHSIYASSLKSCYDRFISFGFDVSNASEIFNQIGYFTYFPANRPLEMGTDTNHSKITLNESSSSLDPSLFVPGKKKNYSLVNFDDFGQKIQANYIITIKNQGKSNITAKQSYFSRSRSITLYGRENDQATVTLSDVSPRQIAISFDVTIGPCPPGFILQDLKCICSINTNRGYIGLDSCNLTLFQAYSKEGYWFGYKENETENEESLISGHCPHGFCTSGGRKELPERANREALNAIMCSDSRSGTLCGRCVDGSVVYYHSLKFKCGPDNLCHLGWLFYILSEIIPVTISFLVIIILNIHYTSGLITGLVFYCQVIEIVRLLSSDLIHSSEIFKTIDSIYSFIYSMFSLDFFVHESMSYCLWKTNRAIDLIVFKCMTILYSFVLVVVVAFGLEKCSINCCRFVRFKRHFKFNGSIIHGLSALLILFYAQCARTFVLSLSFVIVGNKESTNTSTIVYYDGAIKWLSVEHLPYAIPAIILGIVVLIIPPIILLIYPLHNKVLSFLRISEVKCVQSFFRPLDRLKPFFDSFQGCFKDEFRFFSGLYLLYRFFIMLTIVCNYIHDGLLYLEIQLLVMLAFHAICQPYQQKLYNIIDTLLFVNLAVIIAITYYTLTYSVTPFVTTINQTGLLVIDFILIILPMVVAVCALVYYIVQKCWTKRINQNEERIEMVNFDADEFPDRGLYESFEKQ